MDTVPCTHIPDIVFACTVGQKPSKAEFFLDDYTDVIALLKSLKVVSTKSNRNYSLSDMQSFMKDASRPLISSAAAAGFTRNANSDSSFRRTSSRYALQNALQPVIEEDQSAATGDATAPADSSRRSNGRRKRSRWVARVQQLAVLGLIALILRWRRGVTSARDKKLLMYLVASIGVAWSLGKLRSKSGQS